MLSLPLRPLRVEADPVRLVQVLTNLLNNAAKYPARAKPIRPSDLQEVLAAPAHHA